MTGCYGSTREDRDKARTLDRWLDSRDRGRCQECGAKLEPAESWDERGLPEWKACERCGKDE